MPSGHREVNRLPRYSHAPASFPTWFPLCLQGSPEVTEDLEGNAIDMTAANNGFGHAYTPEVVAKTPKMAEVPCLP